ncbi:MAG TPA: thioredoxin domain-containing protein [Caulifigura sp.]|jgi:thioredoxin|nr:thioredoxin domain-containing protein [Caulifigura sp.]
MSRRALLFFTLLLAAGCNPPPDLKSIAPPDDAWFKENVTSQSMPVIVDFNATWCGPCKMLKPYLEQMERDHPGKVKVVPIDVDSRDDLAAHYKVNTVPYLVMMKGGKVIDVCRGAPPTYEALMDWAGEHIK